MRIRPDEPSFSARALRRAAASCIIFAIAAYSAQAGDARPLPRGDARSAAGGDARSLPAAQQRDPELRDRLQRVIESGDCFTNKFDSIVWYKSMEPRLKRFVSSHDQRIEILNHVYCEAGRDPKIKLPPDLVLALIEVESRFDNWAVSSAGAVGLMQVMPFWPRQLGVQNQLVRVAPNIRMGCEILRYYLQVEHNNWPRALARYNGSVGRNRYPALVMARWQSAWRF